jgi:hypothetical protein
MNGDIRQEARGASSLISKFLRLLTRTFTAAAGVSLGGGLVILRLVERGTEEGWRLYPMSRIAENWTQVQSDQWPHVWVILMEGLAAGAAISIAFSYTVNNVTQKIQTVYRQLKPLKLPADLVHVESDTRSWLNQLSHKASAEQENTINSQRVEIQRLNEAHAGFEQQIADLKNRAVALENQLKKDETLFQRFDKFAEDVDKFATDIKRAAEQMRRDRPRPA